MNKYTTRRLLLFFPTLLGMILLVFVIMRVVPGDPALILLAGDGNVVDPQQLAELRARLGTDRGILEQLGEYYVSVFRLDFGESLFNRQNVMKTILQRFPLSLQIAVMAVTITAVIGVIGGVVSAQFQDRWPDYVLRIFSIGGLAIPTFWVGILLVMALVIFFDWIPTLDYHHFWDNPMLNLQLLFLPALVVGYRSAAIIIRMTRATVIEVLREDYIRTAMAKGLGPRLVLYRHALKNALLPVITLLGFELGIAFGGLVVIETVFNLPGIGLLLVESIRRRDYPTVQAVVVFIAFGVLLVNLIVDLLYAWLDPRIRYA